MKPRLRSLLVAGFLAVTLGGCSKPHDGDDRPRGEQADSDAGESKQGAGHDDPPGHGHDGDDRDYDDDHDHDREGAPVEGARLAADGGLILSPETRRALGLQVAPVEKRFLTRTLQFAAQLHAPRSMTPGGSGDPATSRWLAMGFVPAAEARHLASNQIVSLVVAGQELRARVSRVISPSTLTADAEVLIETPPPSATNVDHAFARVSVEIAGESPVIAVPRSALLRAAEGDFVYAARDGALVRRAVKIGVQSPGEVEIESGLESGDTVVTQPVEELWLIELRARKGGGHGH